MKATNLDLAIVLLLLLLISFGLYSVEYFFLTSLLIGLVLYKANPSTSGVYLIWFFFNASGLWSDVYKIPKAGLLTFLLALAFLYVSEFNHKINFKKHICKFLPVAAIFIFFYSLGPMHSYSTEKMIYIIYKGIFFIICFLVLLLNPHVNYIKIIVLVLLSVFQYYSYMHITLNWSGPDFFSDFGSYRRFFTSGSAKLRDKLINYQEIGLLAVIVFSFLLNLIPNKRTIKKNDIFFYLGIVTCLLIILYSGSRQSLYSLPIIYLMHLFFDRKVSSKAVFINAIIGVVLASVLFLTILNHTNSVFKEEEGNTIAEKIHRPKEILDALQLIQSSPLLGHGLGGFASSYDNERYYPHNIFLELLCETGFIGTLILFVYLILLLKNNQVSLKDRANSGFLVVPIFTALFMRANLSSDLIETVYVFSFLIAWSSLKNNNKEIEHYENF